MNSKKRTYKATLLALLGVLLLTLAFGMTNGNKGSVAQASAPLQSADQSQAQPQAPLTDFSLPDLLSYIGDYDNYPGIAASPVDGSITVDWMSDRGDGDATIWAATNAGFAQETFPTSVRNGEVGLLACKNQFGPCPIENDSQGNRHMLYWEWPRNGALCIYYAKVLPGGAVSTNEQIPGSCEGGLPRKGIDIAVEDNGAIHMAAARDNTPGSLLYWHRDPSGTWDVIRETIPNPCGQLSDISVVVSNNGVLMVAYKDCGQSGSGTDIHTATRISANNWDVESISAACCSYCPGYSNAYLPNLKASPDGGIRVSWADGRCNGQETDIYYREWNPATGWDGSPIVRVAFNSGKSYHNDIAIDPSGEAHIVWADDTSSPFGYYRVFYAHGRGTTFTGVEIPFQQWAGGAWQRDVAIDEAYGQIHVAFATVRTDSAKDNYYSHAVSFAGGPTNTPTATNTSTPTNTPTPPCSGDDDLDFQDICEGSTFYENIRNVFEAGIMNGYPCGSPGEPCLPPANKPYFRPSNSATRGQMAKIVVIGSGMTVITPTAATFEDVPVGSTFFSFVETAAENRVIVGYPCGGPGEPCVAPGNRPYYRPNSAVTRGQLTKMVSTAFDFTEPISNVQSFEDVAPGSPFFEFVQRLSARSIILGYPCGGPGEPCVAPGNRPYFRPGNTVSRAQTAKIIDQSMMQPSPTVVPTMTSTPVPPPQCEPSVILYAVTASGDLISFDAETPGTLLTTDTITGLQNDETIKGIDFRPATGELYALGSSSALYTLNVDTGAATQVGASGQFTLTGNYFGFDFNPTVDRIRVVSDLDQNLRINPNNGALAATDTPLAYAVGDPNQNEDPFAVGAGYTNNYPGGGTTTLYNVDSELDVLTSQSPPNDGTLNTIGALGVNIRENAGLDILACDNTAYGVFAPVLAGVTNGGVSSNVYTISLTTGEATLVGEVGGGNIEVTSASIMTGPAQVPTTTPTMTATAQAGR